MTNFNNLSSLNSENLPQQNTQRLEQIWSLPSTSRTANRTDNTHSSAQSVSSFVKRFGQQLLAFLLGEKTIRIWTSYSESGVMWHVYDPASDRISSHASENDLRAWIETRHLS